MGSSPKKQLTKMCDVTPSDLGQAAVVRLMLARMNAPLEPNESPSIGKVMFWLIVLMFYTGLMLHIVARCGHQSQLNKGRSPREFSLRMMTRKQAALARANTF